MFFCKKLLQKKNVIWKKWSLNSYDIGKIILQHMHI